LDIVDAQTIWQCNASDIRLSTDGGQTWQGSPGGRGQPLCQVSAVDDEAAWYLSPSKLEVTMDGGVTTQDVSLPEGVQPTRILAISLRTPGEGYVLYETGILYTTLDGGESWSSQNLGLEEKYGEMKSMPPGGIVPAAMRFFDANHGVIILNLVGGGSKVVALRTADGGQTWVEEVVPSEIGVPYLTRDGKFLTLNSFFNDGQIAVLRYKGD
jgi:photosystem II stability/assembly factor-like uncharacterized protein